MKKLLCAILTIAMTAALLSGCDLFTSGQKDEENPGSAGDIKMTDNYTFSDPTDIEFEKRYVLYYDESSDLVSSGTDYGVLAAYDIFYADADDAPAGSYNFLIIDTPEHAQDVISLYASKGSVLTTTEEDSCVLCGFTDADAMEGNLVMLQSYGVIPETTVSAYVESYASSLGGTLQ